MNKFQVLWHLYRYFGPRWLAYRLGYALRIRSGWIRHQMPAMPWVAQDLTWFLIDPNLAEPQVYLAWRKEHTPEFFFAPSDRPAYKLYFERWDRISPNPCQEADDLSGGVFRYFDHTPLKVGCPPDWHTNPFTGQNLPADRHWSRIDDFSHGDIKVIWDLSRFGFVYPLVRAYWRSGDEAYPGLFWQLVEDWRSHNPPQLGPNWMCGQEASIRLMALCFGLYAFLDSPATTAEQVVMLAQMTAVTGRHIEANLPHALSQQNNHGVSVGMGLWTIGLLFPELAPSPRWLQKGREVLESLGRNLIYDDGSFSQHSANYQRLVLHDYLWSIRLGELNHKPLSDELIGRVGLAEEFMYQVQDEESGRLPGFGHNDGSLVLRLESCDYQDYRPAIQATHYLVKGERRYPDGPWDEDLLWLFGPQALTSPVNAKPRADFCATKGGFETRRTNSGFLFTHCASFRYRPAHADLLNADIWWRGQNITFDPGTYSYNAPPPWDHPFDGTNAHNAVTVDGQDQMERVSRFLWLPWAKGKSNGWQSSPKGLLAYWEGEQDGYRRLPHPVRARRGILQLGDEAWLVIDRLESEREHVYRLQWLLPDCPYTWDEQRHDLILGLPRGKYQVSLSVTGPGVYTLARASVDTPRGWKSPYYYDRQPALSLDCSVTGKTLLFWTLFAPAPCRVVMEEATGRVESDTWQAQLILATDPSRRLVQSASWIGDEKDQFNVH